MFFREELERKWKIEKKMSFGSNPFGKASVGGDNPFAANTAAPPKTDELKPTFGGFGSGASFGAGKRNVVLLRIFNLLNFSKSSLYRTLSFTD